MTEPILSIPGLKISGRTEERQRTIVLTGTFDVRNYGDLLFPLIAAKKLLSWGMRVRPASPTGRSTGWRDAVKPEPLVQALFNTSQLSGILIGGGNIIHARPVTLPDYAEGSMPEWAYGGLWLGATLAGAMHQVPVAWNAPGVPYSFAENEGALVNLALAAASYVSVRDEKSAELLAPFSASVVPDTALDLAELWSLKDLEPDFRALLARSTASSASNYVAIHVKERSLAGPVEALAPTIDALSAKSGRVPILIAIGHCHGDKAISTRLGAALTGPFVDLSDPAGLREIAAAIAFADGYVGASMHGYATAAAYGRPGIIVGRPKLAKMAGLLQHLGRSTDETEEWPTALAMIAARFGESATQIPASVRTKLDEHWQNVGAAFAAGHQAKAAEMDLLQLEVSNGSPSTRWLDCLLHEVDRLPGLQESFRPRLLRERDQQRGHSQDPATM